MPTSSPPSNPPFPPNSVTNILLSQQEYSPTVRYYFKSLLRGFHKRREIPAGGPGMSQAVLTYEYIYGSDDDPSTREPVGAICPVTEAASLAAVERRERTVEILLRSSLLRIEPRPSGLHNTWPRLAGRRARAIFRDLMRRALYQCDAIQDFEAQAVMEVAVPVSAYLYTPTADEQSRHIPRWKRPRVIFGPEREEVVIDGSTVEEQRYLYRVIVPNRARVLQVAYMRSLSTDDLMGLFMLAWVALVSWRESRRGPFAQLQMHNHPVEDQPVEDEPIENVLDGQMPLESQFQLVAFHETILSRGSCFLFCDVRRYGERATHHRQMLDDTEAVHGEINANPHLEQLLHVTLEEELCARLGVSRAELTQAVEAEVAEKIGVEGAFAVHPDTQENGLDPGYWPAPEWPSPEAP